MNDMFRWRMALAGLASFLEDSIGPTVLEIRKSGALKAEAKTDFRDIRTEADLASERMLVDYLINSQKRDMLPSFSMRGEESTNESANSEYEAVIDPIDGTLNFANGLPFFGISVGFLCAGLPFAGIMHFPKFKITTMAFTGVGAFTNKVQLGIDADSIQPHELLIGAGLIQGTEHLFVPLRQRFANVLALGSATYEAFLVAKGKLKAYVHTGATSYDIAASTVIVRESGGVVLGIETDGLDFSKDKIPVIFAREKWIAEEIRKIVLNA